MLKKQERKMKKIIGATDSPKILDAKKSGSAVRNVQVIMMTL